MSFPNVTSVDALAFGRTPIQGVVRQTRAPATTDVIGPFGTYPIGQRWIDQTGNAEYVLTSLSTSNGVTTSTWVATGGGSVDLSSLTGDTGTAVPSAGNIKLSGTTNQITTAASGSTVTFTIPATFIAPGSIASTTTLTGGTGITATTGNITATSGNLVVTAAANGLVFTNAAATSGTTTATLNGRVGQVTITTPSIAAGATFAITISNTAITGSSTQVLYSLTGGTTGAALSIQSYANTANQSVVTINNGTGATTNTASLILNFIVLN